MKPFMYFGHPINVYNTALETELLKKIKETFPRCWIANPNEARHEQGYQHSKETTGSGMDYFLKEVLPKCSAGIFLPFRDGKWGIGVFGEAEFLAKCGCPIWQITADSIISEIDHLREVPVLSIEETRARIRTATGEIVPY